MKNLILLCCLSATLAFASRTAAESPLHIARLDTDSLPEASTGSDIWKALNPGKLKLRSAAALVVDESGNEVYAKQENDPMPIASITKLMTAMVILDGDLPTQETITITKENRDLIQLTGSRLEYGARLSREELLKLALMASENRAANALARTWPGGSKAFIVNRIGDFGFLVGIFLLFWSLADAGHAVLSFRDLEASLGAIVERHPGHAGALAELGRSFLADDLEPSRVDELTMGVRAALPRNSGSLTLTYVNRDYGRQLDYFVGDLGTTTISDPASAKAVRVSSRTSTRP